MFPGWTYGPPPFHPPICPPTNDTNGSNATNNNNTVAQPSQPPTYMTSPPPPYHPSNAPWVQPHMGYSFAPPQVQYIIPSAHQGRPMGLQTWTNMQRAAQIWPPPAATSASYQSLNAAPYAQPGMIQPTAQSTSAQGTGGNAQGNGREDSGEAMFKMDEELLGPSAFNNPQLPLGTQHWPPSLVPGQRTNVNTLYYCTGCKIRSEQRVCPDCRTPNVSMHGSFDAEQYNDIWRNR